MLAIIIEFEVKPECRAEFEARLRVGAADTLKDDGCQRMEVLQVRGQPNNILLPELWRDDAAIEAHRSKPGHSHAWQAPMIVSKRVISATLTQ